MKPLSLRAYARHRECTLSSVQEAIASGRLRESLVRQGKSWKIRSAAAADAEWKATTHVDRIPLSGPAAGDGDMPPNLAESRARREAAEAALAEIELAEKQAELIPARDVENRLANVFTSCKTKLLGVPARARQLDPTLTSTQLELVTQLVREALADLAGSEEPRPKARKRRAARAEATA